MTLTKKWAAMALILSAVLSLAACSSNNNNEAGTESGAPLSSAVVSESPSGSNASASASPQTSAASSTEPAVSANPAASSAASGQAEQVKKLLMLAKKGEAPGIPFKAHSSLIDDVTKAWGKEDKVDYAGSGFYATYADKHAVFGYNKGSQIFDVRSSSSDLQQLTLTDIEAALGKPVSTKQNGNDNIYIYTASDQFQLKFIIPSSTGKVDHISVFSPQDSVNNMAG